MAGASLERSCGEFVAFDAPVEGVRRLRAWFGGAAYARHRHDTYAIGLTDSGVQRFWYRGGVQTSTPGQVVVLHPDEAHDGYAGTAEGFGYRLLYVEPARIADACRSLLGRACALPFVARAVLSSAALRRAIERAFAAEATALAADAAVFELAEALLAEAGGPVPTRRIDERAVARAQALLDGATDRIVHSSELEAASGLSRFELARQFKARLGTSPYRYSLLRRLERARSALGTRPIADVALDAGFADQAHFTRAFKAAFGLSPARYAMLSGKNGVRAN